MVKKHRLHQIFSYNIILVAAAFLLSLLLILSGSLFGGNSDPEEGGVSDKRIVTPQRMLNQYATDKNKEEARIAAQNMEPLLKRDTEAEERIRAKIQQFFQIAQTRRKEAGAKAKEAVQQQAAALATSPLPYPTGNETAPAVSNSGGGVAAVDNPSLPGGTANVGPPPETATPAQTPLPSFTIALTSDQKDLLLHMADDEYDSFVKVVDDTAENSMNQGISEVDAKVLLALQKNLADTAELDPSKQDLAYEIIAANLEPTFVVDEEATQKARDEKANDYNDVYYLKGQMIVDAGEIISPEAYMALTRLGLVNKTQEENLLLLAGAILMLALIFGISLAYLSFFGKELLRNKKLALLLFTLYVACLALCRAASALPYPILPIMLFALLTAMLIEDRVAIVMNGAVSLIVFLMLRLEVDAVLFFLATGTLVALLSRYTTDRSKVILIGTVMSALNALLVLGLFLFFSNANSYNLGLYCAAAAINGMLTVIFCIGSLPFWEAAFGIVTAIKLLDLTSPSSPLLRRLTIEAPGTYHHSLIVANLGEAAALDIGANPALARVGGYYHDVGKLKYPQYFAENQAGENPHDNMDPLSSVQIITSHVSFGLEISGSYRLPPIVRDIIEQHHGNTLVKYFFVKYGMAHPEETVNESDFRYRHRPPQSKEAAIVMLADTVEAAVRSAAPSGKSFDEVETLVRNLMKDKLDDNQLVDSGLTFRDFDMIIHSFMRVFQGMYHHRIAYPSPPVKIVSAQPEATASVIVPLPCKRKRK